jgi:hypothetical protein
MQLLGRERETYWSESETTDYKNNGSHIAYYNFLKKESHKHMLGQDIPQYFARKAKGELLPLTPFSYFDMTGEVIGDLETWYSTSHYTYSKGRVFTSLWRLGEADLETYYAEVDKTMLPIYVQKAASDAYSQGHDTLTFLVELKKSLALFGNLQERFRALLQAKNVARNWLEYRYGWRILYYDVIDIQKTLANLNGERERVSQHAGNSLPTRTVTDYDSVDWGWYDIRWVAHTVLDVSLRGSVVADFEPPKFQFNPFVTGWELIKFSFIVDWFLNVGQWLQALSFAALATNYFAATGVKISATRYSGVDWMGNFQSGVTATTSMSGLSQASYTVRTPTSVDLSPQINVRLDVPKLLDIGALLGSLHYKDLEKLIKL